MKMQNILNTLFVFVVLTWEFDACNFVAILFCADAVF
jgi:hypothetical protein